MKKKILFTIGVLDTGGVAKSLLSLLSTIDKEKYDISLFIAGHDCGMNKEIPKGIKIYTDNKIADIVAGTNGIKELFLQRHFLLFFGSLIRIVLSKFNYAWAGWWLSQLMPIITKDNYDMIVDYNGQHMLYYMVDKLNGRIKISFFHSDYKMWRYYEKMDRKYYKKVNYIFTISETCVNSLKEIFPEISKKIKLMENISSPKYIMQQASVPINWKRRHRYVLLSLGLVCINKGSDLAIEVAKILKNKHIDFEWIFLGKVSNDLDFKSIVMKEGLEENIHYLGNVNNPYPYILQTDIFVHLSRFEGKSIALDEAKIMCKPIVVSNFSSVKDQFKDGINASICEMNAEDASQKIILLLKDKYKQNKYKAQLLAECHDNSNEINKLYQFLN